MKLFPGRTQTALRWTTSALQPIHTRQDLIRGDVTISDKMNLMVRYINEYWTHDAASGNFWGDSPYPTLSSDWSQPSRSFAVKLTNTLSSRAVNEFQFSIAGNDIIIAPIRKRKRCRMRSASKIPTVFPHGGDGLVGGTVPSLFWGAGGYANIWHQAPWANREDLYIWKDDFSLVFGSHDLKVGALFSHNFKDEPGVGAGGVVTSKPRFRDAASKPFTVSATCCSEPVLLNYTEIATTEIAEGRWQDFEVYVNDTYKIHPRVTLTMGLRYSRFTPRLGERQSHFELPPESLQRRRLQHGIGDGGRGNRPWPRSLYHQHL